MYLKSNMDILRIVDGGGLTLAIPQFADAASRLLRDKDAIPVEEKAYQSIVMVGLRWPWLALPASI